MTPAQLATRVKARAGELGFDLVGIASAEPFDADLQRTLDWIDRGYNGSMAWITPERTRLACNPDDLLAGAQSIVVVGASYNTTEPPPDDGILRGTVARYARGSDYHDVLKARLRELADSVQALGPDGTLTRVFVDSSPLLERAAAVRAGLGFVGKNTNLLTGKAGSWLLLGALLTDLALAPDPPNERDCGRCRLCLDACPTDAFPAPFVLDATRCISYLTIELKGPIPRELRPGIGDHIFGCDVCQDVCPWNRAQRPGGWPEIVGQPGAGSPALADLLALDDAAFRDRYRRTPLARTKRRGVLRNAAVVLGNVGTAADLDTLAVALRDPEPMVRSHAAWAVGQIGAPEGIALLEAARTHEMDASVLEEIDLALTALGDRHSA